MNDIQKLTKEAFEPKIGRPLTEAEAADFAMHLRRFAAFLLDCSKDEVLMTHLGLRKEGEATSAGPRAVDNTIHNGQKPIPVRVPAESSTPTAPSRDIQNREPSAVSASLSAGTVPDAASNQVSNLAEA